MKYMSIGRVVIVSIPPEDLPNNPVAIFQGQKMRIANRVMPSRATQPYYELVGAESRYGTPYGFLRDWLIPIQ